MKKRAFVVVTLAAALLWTGGAVAQEQSPWLHVRVVEEGEGGTRVNVNVPVSLVQVVADIAERELEKELAGNGSQHLDLDLDDHDIEIADIRRAWGELRDAGDAEFVEIQEDDEFVRISRAGDKILIQFDDVDNDDSGRVEVPVSVVDALLSGDGERLNIRAALDEMIVATSGEIVLIEDGETTVRIWIE